MEANAGMPAGKQPDASPVRIYSAEWVLPVSAPPLAEGAVAVEGDTIRAVGPLAEVRAAWPEAELTDFHHAILLPGFVNCHSHIEYAVFRGLLDNRNFGPWILDFIDHRRRLQADDFATSALLGASECAASGITTLADATFTGASLEAISEAGLRARIYQEVFGIDDHGLGETMDGLKAAVDELKGRENSLIEAGVFPHAPYTVSAGLYRAVARMARERGLKMATHLAESREESKYIRSGSGVLALDLREKVGWDHVGREPFGVSPVKYLQQWDVYGPDFLAAHCVQVDEHDIAILAKSGVPVAHCPKSNAKLGCGIAPLPAFLDAGIRVGFGTDSPASSNVMDMFGEMRTAIFLHRGVERDASVLDAARCLEIATLGGAKALGLEDRVGSLQPGKQADIIAVDMEHSHFYPGHDPYSALVYGGNQEDVFFVMVAGRPIYERKVFLTLDERDIIARAREVKEKLWHPPGPGTG